jgi:hypothetical protein
MPVNVIRFVVRNVINGRHRNTVIDPTLPWNELLGHAPTTTIEPSSQVRLHTASAGIEPSQCHQQRIAMAATTNQIALGIRCTTLVCRSSREPMPACRFSLLRYWIYVQQASPMKLPPATGGG